MGIQLDWDIEADTARFRKVHQEDPQERRRRWRKLFRFILIIVLLLAVVVAAVYLIQRRLEQVDGRLEQLLKDTIAAEVAALRIGNEAGFMDIQRSATDDWLLHQQQVFDAYQNLKISSDIQLTGTVTDIEISGQRARALVEEIESGVPYVRAWFYWRYEDGWRHVPPDYTFWGEQNSLVSDYFELRYRMVDDRLARQLDTMLTDWLREVCAFLACETLPPITLDIVPDPLPEAVWTASSDAWQMVIPSPYTDRARADQPFTTLLRLQVATLLSTRLVDHTTGNLQPVYPADATFLRSAVITWLTGEFVQMDTGSYLIGSLADGYGEQAVRVLLNLLEPASDMGKLRDVTGVADLSQAGLDWRDFLSWRINTEQDLIAQRNEEAWLRLIDTRNEEARIAAYDRFVASAPPETAVVVATVPGVSSDGLPQIEATVQFGSDGLYRQEIVRFNLVNNVWLRAG